MAAKGRITSVRDRRDAVGVIGAFTSLSSTAGKGGKKKNPPVCGGLRKSVVLYLVRELRRRVATRLAEIIDQTTALQRAAFSARCKFGMAGFTNMCAESREVARSVNGAVR